MELTDNDRQRIEQAFNDAIQLIVTSPYVERGGPHNYSELISRLHNLFNPVLEAERNELRNKIQQRHDVVNGLMQKMKSTLYWHERKEEKDFLTELLNSLKTK